MFLKNIKFLLLLKNINKSYDVIIYFLLFVYDKLCLTHDFVMDIKIAPALNFIIKPY